MPTGWLQIWEAKLEKAKTLQVQKFVIVNQPRWNKIALYILNLSTEIRFWIDCGSVNQFLGFSGAENGKP